MLKLIIAVDSYSVTEALYPGIWSDRVTAPEDRLESALVSKRELADLWTLIEPQARTAELLTPRGIDPCGIPHYGPQGFDQVSADFPKSLLAIPVHERWKRARDWAEVLAGRPPNKERLADFKMLLKELCKLAGRIGEERFLAALPE